MGSQCLGDDMVWKVQSAKDAPEMVAIDGCSIGCAKAILERAQVPIKSYLVLTEIGIEKNKDFNLKREEIDHVRENQILGARFGIRSIPVQVFYDKNGEEVFRHMGFYPEAEVLKQLSKLGIE